MICRDTVQNKEYVMRQPVRLRLIIAAVLLLASALPDIGIQINTFGFNWTFYRAAVVVLALVTVVTCRGEIRLPGRREAVIWMAFLLIWFIYGLVLMFLSPYADTHRGLQELLSIFSGILAFFILTGLRLSRSEIEFLLRLLFFILLGLIILGYWEIITGKHLSYSMFSDPENLTAKKRNIHSASGIMYNTNDFSALLTLMCTVAIGRFRFTVRRMTLDPGWLLVAAVVVINRINDANISNFAIIIGGIAYFWFAASGDRRKTGLIVLVLLALIVVAGIVIYAEMGEKDGGIFSRLSWFVTKSSEGRGSLYTRLLIYRDAFSVTWITGFLGLGPAGFPVYFTANPSDSGFVNPHSFIFEIMSQYGLIICIGFLILLVMLMARMLKIRRDETDPQRKEWGRTGFIMLLVYVITSFAPSSYILMTLHWTLLALLVLISEKERERGI